MTQQIVKNFLSWIPDEHGMGEPGLQDCNAIHDTDGYKPRRSATAFTTLTPLGTVTRVQAKPVGSADNIMMAWIKPGANTTATMYIGNITDGETLTASTFTSAAIATLSAQGNVWIEAFSVAELGQNVLLNARARAELAGGTITSYNLSGLASYSV